MAGTSGARSTRFTSLGISTRLADRQRSADERSRGSLARERDNGRVHPRCNNTEPELLADCTAQLPHGGADLHAIC